MIREFSQKFEKMDKRVEAILVFVLSILLVFGVTIGLPVAGI